MKKIQKVKNENIVNQIPENGKIKFGGKLGVDVEATTGSVKGKGGFGFFFQLPTLLALDLFRKIGEHFKQDHTEQ